MRKIFVLCLACTLGIPTFASAIEENPYQALERAFTRYVGLFRNGTAPCDTEELSALKSTFEAYAARQDLDKNATLDATLGLGLMAFFGGPGPRDYRTAWHHFEKIQKDDDAPLDTRNRVSNFMVILITKGHVPEGVSPRGKILMLLSTHTIRDDVMKHVQAFFATHSAFVPSVSTAPTTPQKDLSDCEDASGLSSASTSVSDEDEEEDEEEEEEEEASVQKQPCASLEESEPLASVLPGCARTRPYRGYSSHASENNKRRRR